MKVVWLEKIKQASKIMSFCHQQCMSGHVSMYCDMQLKMERTVWFCDIIVNICLSYQRE